MSWISSLNAKISAGEKMLVNLGGVFKAFEDEEERA